jgi:hypothetical protein
VLLTKVCANVLDVACTRARSRGSRCGSRRRRVERGKLVQCRRPVGKVKAYEPLGADVAENVTAVVNQQFDAVLLHEARLVLAVAAEEPALLGQPRMHARFAQAGARGVLGLLAAKGEEIDRVGGGEAAKAVKGAVEPGRRGLVVGRVAVGGKAAGKQHAANVGRDLGEGHCWKGRREGREGREGRERREYQRTGATTNCQKERRGLQFFRIGIGPWSPAANSLASNTVPPPTGGAAGRLLVAQGRSAGVRKSL